MKAVTDQRDQNVHTQHDSELNPRISRVILGLVLLVGACVPLLIIPGLNNSIELPRAIFSRGIAALVLLLFVLSPFRKELLNSEHKIFVVAALVLATMLSGATAVSVNANQSLWGEYQSQFGLLTWLSMLVIGVIAVTVLNTPWRQHLFNRVLIGSSIIAVLYGLIRTLVQGTIIWAQDPLPGATGVMSLSDHTGAYLLMVIPLTMAELCSMERRWPFVLILVGQVALLAITQVYYAWAGALTALFILGVFRLYIGGRNKLAGRIALTGLFLVLLLTLLVALVDLPGGLNSLSSMDARLSIWRTALQLITKRPFLGYGPDVAGRAFQEMYPLDLVEQLGYQPTIASAGNIWLDIGLSIGLVGLAAYIFFLVSAGLLIWRRLVSGVDRHQQFLLAGMASALVAHFVVLQVSTETVASAALFWLLLGASVSDSSLTAKQARQSPTRSWKYLPLVAASMILVGMVTIPPLFADRAFWQGQGLDPTSNQALERYVEATQQWPIEPTYHIALAEAYWATGQPAAASSELVSTAERNPENSEIWAAVGDLYSRWGMAEPDRFSLSIAAFRRAIELSPDTAAYHVGLGQVLVEKGRLDDAVREFERALAINPYEGQTKLMLDQVFEQASQIERGD